MRPGCGNRGALSSRSRARPGRSVFHKLFQPRRGEKLFRQRHHRWNDDGRLAGWLHAADVQRAAEQDGQRLRSRLSSPWQPHSAGAFGNPRPVQVAPAEIKLLNPEDLVLSVSTTPAPEPLTWAMMLAGFAGLGYFGYKASRRTRLAAA
jgi:hypothetical protein